MTFMAKTCPWAMRSWYWRLVRPEVYLGALLRYYGSVRPKRENCKFWKCSWTCLRWWVSLVLVLQLKPSLQCDRKLQNWYWPVHDHWCEPELSGSAHLTTRYLIRKLDISILAESAWDGMVHCGTPVSVTSIDSNLICPDLPLSYCSKLRTQFPEQIVGIFFLVKR